MQFLKSWLLRLIISVIVGQTIANQFEHFNDLIFIGAIIGTYLLLTEMSKKM